MSNLIEQESDRKPGHDGAATFEELRDAIQPLREANDRDVGFLTEYIELVAQKATQMIAPPTSQLRINVLDEFISQLTDAVCQTFEASCRLIECESH